MRSTTKAMLWYSGCDVSRACFAVDPSANLLQCVQHVFIYNDITVHFKTMKTATLIGCKLAFTCKNSFFNYGVIWKVFITGSNGGKNETTATPALGNGLFKMRVFDFLTLDKCVTEFQGLPCRFQKQRISQSINRDKNCWHTGNQMGDWLC